jgi:uncharacterized damage-inducible protein DinB
MRETNRIADELRRAYDGDAWHGPSVRTNLESTDVRIATARYVPAGHTICEIVLHMTAWTREVTRRLHTGVARDPENGDWPVRAVSDDTEWAAVLEALDAANAELVEAIAALDEARLHDRIGDVRDRALGAGVSCYVMLQGLIQHHAYHGGQIALLKRAAASGERYNPVNKCH